VARADQDDDGAHGSDGDGTAARACHGPGRREASAAPNDVIQSTGLGTRQATTKKRAPAGERAEVTDEVDGLTAFLCNRPRRFITVSEQTSVAPGPTFRRWLRLCGRRLRYGTQNGLFASASASA
jgi:hypothetical protein